jgi:hypothetical protein
VVACEPAEVDAGMGLSDPVLEALPHAVRAVEEIVAQALAAGPEPDVQEPDVQEPDVQGAADEQGCMAD